MIHHWLANGELSHSKNGDSQVPFFGFLCAFPNTGLFQTPHVRLGGKIGKIG